VYLQGKIHLKEQDHEKASYTNLLKKDHGYIPALYIKNALEGKNTNEEWAIPFMKDFVVEPSAQTIDRFIRAITPWPGAYTTVRVKEEEKRMKVLKARCEEEKLVIDEVQLEGKNPVSWKQFVMGYPDFQWK
jgi:methionyl-tRNA formyltransferase